MAAPRVPVVVAAYTPRARAGGVSRSVAYYSWRPGADRPREHPRVWHAHGGRELDYAAARAEIAAAARDAPYTYRLVLSPNAEQGLEPGDYAAVLGRHFDRWYLVAHHAGDHPHAHAVAPAARCLGVRELADLRAALGERSRHREAERGRESLTSGREARVREPSREPAQERDLW